MAISHIKSITIADGTDTNIVRPSDWNSAHNMFFTLSGNTNNASTVSGQNIILSGGANVTLIGSNSVIGISAAAGGGGGGAALSAGTQSVSTGTVAFANSNGITFGMSGSNQITASHNGLTTARASNDGVGLNTAATQVTWTVNSGGISLNAGAYLTTAALSNHSHGNPTLNLTNLGGTTASNSAGLTLSLSAAAQSVQTQNLVSINGSTGPITLAVGSSLSSSTNGSTITFGLASNITTALQSAGAYLTTAAQSGHSHGNPTLNLTNLSGTTASASNGLTLSLSAAAQSVQTQNSVVINGSSGQISLNVGSSLSSSANGSSLTFGLASNITTALQSAGAYLTTAALSNHSHGVTLNLTNINGTTGGNSAGINLSLSAIVPAQTVQPVAYSAANGSANFSTLTFANSNGVSFSTGTQGLYATVKTDYLTTAAQSGHSHGNPTLNLTNLSGTTASNSAGLTLSLSAAPAGGGGVALSAGTQSVNTGTVAFANSNGITFGMSNSNQITASHNGLTTAAQSDHSHGVTLNLTNINGTTGGNSNGITLSLSAVVPAQTVQTQNMVSVNGSTGAMSLTIASSLSLSTNGSTISFGLASNITTALQSAGPYLTTAMQSNAVTLSNIRVSAGTTSNLLSAITFSNANGITFGLNASTLTASHNGLTTAAASNHSHGFSASGGSSAFQTLNFANSNGFTFSNSNGSVIGSYTVPAVTVFSNSNNVSFGLNGSTITATATFAQTNQTLGLYAVSNTAGQSSSSTFDARTLSFHGAGIASVGYSGGSVVISVPSGGGAGDGYNSAQFTNSTANSTMPIVWAGNSNGSGNITMGLTGSTVTASAPSGGGAGGTATMWQPFNEGVNVAGQQGNAILHIVPLPTPTPAALGELQVDRLCLPLVMTNATNSTGTVTLSYSMGLYTRSANTRLALAYSTSGSMAVTFSGTINNSTYVGVRLMTIPWTTTIQDGRYYVAQWTRTSTANANCSISQMLVSQMNSNFSGFYGVASNRSYQWPLGYGVFSASITTAMPSSIAFSQIDGTASLAARPPSFFMISSTA